MNSRKSITRTQELKPQRISKDLNKLPRLTIFFRILTSSSSTMLLGQKRIAVIIRVNIQALTIRILIIKDSTTEIPFTIRTSSNHTNSGTINGANTTNFMRMSKGKAIKVQDRIPTEERTIPVRTGLR